MKFQFNILEDDIVVYESEESFESYEAAEEMAQEWCSDYSQGSTYENPDAEYGSSLDYDIEEIDE